ncbi:MAG: Methyltransferase domain-containing protein [Pelagibacterales bacterium]|nr:Methyltransferase domain-containing protein [Pelagibacterales bacterium]|tara:strand:+ start:7184 stop:7867 length:684 start_codon:yes stop_codon:yes gene_type:complete
MREFNLLDNYPKLSEPRYVSKNLRTISHRIVAANRQKDFFDGDRNHGYGGFKYDGRWKVVADKIFSEYKINEDSSILQINSEKGFLLKDIKDKNSKINITGLETSQYAKDNTLDEVKKNITLVQNYNNLKFEDNKFDFIIGLGIIYTLTIDSAFKTLKEIERVGKGKSFITLASYSDEEDYWLFKDWTLIGSTILKKEEWLEILKAANYSGDYYFTNSKTLNIARKK